MKLKIGGRLMLAGAAIAVIPFTLMGVIVSMEATQGISSLVGNQLVTLTKSMVDNTERTLDGYSHTSLASHGRFRQADRRMQRRPQNFGDHRRDIQMRPR